MRKTMALALVCGLAVACGAEEVDSEAVAAWHELETHEGEAPDPVIEAQAQALVEHLLTLPDDQARVDYMVSLIEVEEQGEADPRLRSGTKTLACVGGAIVVGAAAGGCATGNGWACVSAVGGAVKWVAECVPKGSGTVVDVPNSPDWGGCHGSKC
jgi:hypothetical protein